jgi:hypothetical protein
MDTSNLTDEKLSKFNSLLSKLEDVSRAIQIQEDLQDPLKHKWHTHVDRRKPIIISAEAYARIKNLLEGN